jgi:predicted dehydrogenase
MLEKEEKNIDAVTVSTPDHMHAFAAMMAMELGKHVYVQKPLTHTVYEARKLTEGARKYGVVTQMGNQGHSGEGVRRFCEMLWSDAIGPVHEVHSWTNRPIWPQGIPEPLPEEPVPDTMNWDLWLGPAPSRPYNSKYAPFNWRGWWDFGTGALGDMACHILDPVNWGLLLRYPTSVECVSQEGKNNQTAPNKSIIRYEFPARPNMPPVTVYWYDGGNMPPRPKEIGADVKLGDGDNGSLFIGEKGMIAIGTYGGNPRLLPESLAKDYRSPDPWIPRRPGGHYGDWIQACKGGIPSCSNFDYAGPFTEWVLLGNLSLRCEGKLLWDGEKIRVTNNPEANQYVKTKYRKGWKL